MFRKSLAIIFGIIFSGFVLVQYNDPDPILWIAIYSLAAVTSFIYGFSKLNNTYLWGGALLFFVGSFYFWPETFEGIKIGSGDIKNIEEARESLGLIICGIAFTSFAILNKANNRANIKAKA
jgi:hypothetical protein